MPKIRCINPCPKEDAAYREFGDSSSSWEAASVDLGVTFVVRSSASLRKGESYGNTAKSELANSTKSARGSSSSQELSPSSCCPALLNRFVLLIHPRRLLGRDWSALPRRVQITWRVGAAFDGW